VFLRQRKSAGIGYFSIPRFRPTPTVMPALCRHPLCLSRGPLSLLSSARGPVDAGTRPAWRMGGATVDPS